MQNIQQWWWYLLEGHWFNFTLPLAVILCGSTAKCSSNLSNHVDMNGLVKRLVVLLSTDD